ncbi:MAG: hypothetical protein SVT56_08415 [Chloroflexota bacterium]|nr:hypothetical protein [Chloroflexota bacterium]
MSITQNFLARLFQPLVDQRVREQLSLLETENAFLVGTRHYDESPRDRISPDRQSVLEACLTAWREDPLARRLVGLTSQYVVGGGVDIQCDHGPTLDFLTAFWGHRLNRMSTRVIELCDELSRSGNLFLLISTDRAGMSYLRAVPAADIDRIVPADNDIEQAVGFVSKSEVLYPAYDPSQDGLDANGTLAPVMLHYAINRPSGAQWGESDLAPLLIWLRRYDAWLEDRMRLNRFRNAFLYRVKAQFASEAARRTRQAELAANPPSPGSILVTDESEDWSVISPKLEALDAQTDGLAIKKMIAAGAGVPMHFLAEPEGSTRTTAEAAGGPTYRRFEQRQRYFLWMLADLLQVVTARRALVDRRVDPKAPIVVHGADISARDNLTLAQSGAEIGPLFEGLYRAGLIDAREYLRVVYRFVGEEADLDALLSKAGREALLLGHPKGALRARPLFEREHPSRRVLRMGEKEMDHGKS